MKNRPFNILFGMIIFSVVLFMMYLVFLCLISLIRMEDKITFSSSIVICLIIVSFPISLYVDYKLKSNGYVVCDRISWMSPNTYVKDLSLCR
ncbi:DUF1240 domain-containing protein [Yersinia pestis]|uniref:DUF1240 domain-containing protein n=1 Tax=Yersinia pestis TaxID=632 RepID=UPI0002F5249F|nr:DUF1240 domain-containing protein [Yersinia pestis]